ncbi:sulfotransferase [Porticoccus sp. W117]|uniref:tetratricopeptide repeat-containing sulfotransferase family protein n=1 Tax=Porticoccus sp. W117 TaxID=3054777 RepID=UPI00259164D9|nr:tetratricopeptide repeat-containing sulfotransferase family protein [Porticoccus sp. W117]MDM3871399.1 sulfotransferase [Porticoccus sp. W117]
MQDTSSPIAQSIQQAQKQISTKQFAAALATLKPILEKSPDNTDALYMLAVCQRYQSDASAAHATLNRLKQLAPDFGRAYQEEGHLLFGQQKNEQALACYRRATEFNPALEASWRRQSEILQSLGRQQEAGQTYAQAQRLRELPKELFAVTNHLYEGRLLKAENLCRYFLQKTPHHPEAMRLLAEIGVRFGVYEDAEFLLESAVEFNPDNVQLRLDYIKVLHKRQKFAKSREQAQHLLDNDPNSPLFQSHFAIESMQTGDYEEAFHYFEKVLEKLPEDPATLTSQGHALKTFGRHEEAVASYQAAYRARPNHGDAYYSLANLKTYRFSDAELAAMTEQQQKSDLPHQQRVYFCFALGKAHEDKQDYEQAMHYYREGNELQRRQSRYSADTMTEALADQEKYCTAELFDGRKGCEAPDPIFILGLPRAGSTLLEQILASHSQVDGTLELPHILSYAHRLRGRGRTGKDGLYPAILKELGEDKLQELGQHFIDDTRIHREDAPFFIDKMPNNFRHIALIKLILPNAKIIDARRHPMACCFSGFKQLFAEGQEFTYGLHEVGSYYRDYVKLMDHWDRVLPGQILRVEYEDVVADTETQVRRMLDYLGLPFEQACLEHHKTKRSVRTASSEQVRQPIYKSGLEQWRHFEPWLEPLKSALGPEILERYPI